MLSRKKKNILKVEVRPDPPLPIHPPAPAHHKERISLKKSANEQQINKILESSGSHPQDDKPSSRTSLNLRQRLSQDVKPDIKFQPKSAESQQAKTRSTNAELNLIISTLGQVMKSDPGDEDGIKTKESADKERKLGKLLNCLKDWDNINDQTLVKLITELKDNLETLDDKMSPTIQQIISANWQLRSGKVVSAMEQFISEMLVIRAGFVGIVIQALISKFNAISFSVTSKCAEVDEISLSEQKVFSVTHRNLQKLFHMFPMKQETGVNVMGALYPFMGKDTHIHFCYVTNLLQSIDYLPHAKTQIFHTLVHKLARIDVNIPRHDIEHFSAYQSNASESFSVKAENGGHEMFSMEIDSAETFTPNPLIEVVDLCLNLVLEHLSSEFKSAQKNESLFNTLYSTFETEILPTFALNNVQFLFFYLISLDVSIATSFLDSLWKKAISVNVPAVIRIQVMAYMSGIISRSSCITITTAKRWLTRFADWANAYMDQRNGSSHWSSVNIDAHGPFYAVCQTIFYIFAFRNKELIGSRKCMAFTRTLNLGRLVTSDLNPLKACGNEVAESFVSAAYDHQISYCRTVLERNQRATIPTSTGESIFDVGLQGNANERLESFFPFDPFHLPRSRVWIDPIYRMYDPYMEELKVEKDDPCSQADENDDSIEMELGASYTEKYSLNSSVDFFCNGTSPFKFKSDVKDESYEMNDFID